MARYPKWSRAGGRLGGQGATPLPERTTKQFRQLLRRAWGTYSPYIIGRKA